MSIQLGAATRRSTQSKAARSKTKAAPKSLPVQAPPKPKAAGAAALLSVAVHELNNNNLATASSYAQQAGKSAPALLDYANYVRAQAEYRQKNFEETAKAAAHIFSQTLVSPLIGETAALAVQARLDQDQPKEALNLVHKYYAKIPQPSADFLLARCFQATGDLAQAAVYYQRVYYNYPQAKEAFDAQASLNELRTRLGENYPPPLATAMLGRAMSLISTRAYSDARRELTNVLPQLGGAQRELAQLRLAEIDYFGGKAQDAVSALNSLRVSDSEVDAERLDYLIKATRKADKTASVQPYLDLLASKYPTSDWRLDALVSIADQANVANQPEVYLPLYRACVANFPKSPQASWCQWRVAFESYKRRQPDAPDQIRKEVTDYPSSEYANSALYFLGRLSEDRGEAPAARAYFDAVVDHYPNTYYYVQARTRLQDPKWKSTEPAPDVLQFLRGVAWPKRPSAPSFVPDKTGQKRLDRAQLLHLANLDDWAANELRFGAKNDDGSPYFYAYELAKMASESGSPDQAVRYVKAYAPSYLYLGPEDAPLSFWHLAFPMPYRAALDRYSEAQQLDPFLVAALIRQESEFNVKVISYANAYGLMQVLPSTGREIARRLGVRHFTPAQLLTADTNLRFGTYYFRRNLDAFGERVEPTLAAYNAGKTRADLWLTWGPFREPPEFIESVPFHQTRNYIQVVLRNADMYRRLYGNAPMPPAKPAAKPASAHKAPAHTTLTRKAPVRKAPARKTTSGKSTAQPKAQR